MPIRNIYELPATQQCIRGGEGMCLETIAFVSEELQSDVLVVGMTVLPPGTSMGRHAHADEEEIYLVVEGEGIAELDGEQHRVKKGDVLHNVSGGMHAVMNPCPEDLVVFALSLKVR